MKLKPNFPLKICLDESAGWFIPLCLAFYVSISKSKPLSAPLRPLRGKGVDTFRFRQNALATRGMNTLRSYKKVFLARISFLCRFGFKPEQRLAIDPR